jgi:nucleoside phosphorylase
LPTGPSHAIGSRVVANRGVCGETGPNDRCGSFMHRLMRGFARLMGFAPRPTLTAAASNVLPAERGYRPPTGRFGRARVAVVTIIAEEFAAAQDVFELHENITGTGYFVAGSGDDEEWDVVLMQATDRSNVPVMGDVLTLMEDLRPQVILLVGIAGGLCDGNEGRDGIGPGDVLIADQVTYVEFLKLVPELGPLMRSYAIDHPSVPLRKAITTPIQKTLRLRDHLGAPPIPTDREFKIHIGSIVSGEKVLGDVKSHVQQQLLKPFDKALGVDMESIGMARAVCDGRSSFWYHPRYAVIRGISDLVSAADNDEMRTDWKPFAAQAAAVVAREFVRRLPPDNGAR